jgi:hypothetical protein
MAFQWDQPVLMVHHRELSLFLAWNDETGQIMRMNSDKLEWAWDPVELVGTTVVGTYKGADTAGPALVDFMNRIERGDVVVHGRSDGTAERDIRRWTGTTWDDPLESSLPHSLASYEQWRRRCAALGELTQAEILTVVDGLKG